MLAVSPPSSPLSTDEKNISCSLSSSTPPPACAPLPGPPSTVPHFWARKHFLLALKRREEAFKNQTKNIQPNQTGLLSEQTAAAVLAASCFALRIAVHGARALQVARLYYLPSFWKLSRQFCVILTFQGFFRRMCHEGNATFWALSYPPGLPPPLKQWLFCIQSLNTWDPKPSDKPCLTPEICLLLTWKSPTV